MADFSLPSTSARRIVRLLLVVIGAALVAYSISDDPLYGGDPGFGRAQQIIAAAGIVLALCVFLPYNRASSVLLIAVASVVSVSLSEIAGEVILGARFRPIYQPDDQLIFKFVPNRKSMMSHAPVNGGGTVLHRINSQGFRGEELRPPGQVPRIAVYGDSFIHAFYTPDEETFVVRLGAHIAQRMGMKVEMINAGVSSYGPDQIAVKMEGELPRLRPDAAVVAIFAGNDYGDLMRNKMFRLDAGGALTVNTWTLDHQVRNWLELSQRESIVKRAVRGLLGSAPASAESPSAESVFSMDFLLAEAQREYQSFVVSRDNVVRNTHVDYYSADVSLTPQSESARYKVELMFATLTRIRDVAARAGVPLAFLFIPHPLDVAEGPDWGVVDKARFPAYHPRNQIAPLEAMAKSLGVPAVSLYDIYRAHGADSLYLRGGDDHWNSAGQELAARATADLLVNLGLPTLAPGSRSRP